jgi:hypothetical protein
VPACRRRLLSLVVAATLASGLWSASALAADAQVDVYAFDQSGAISDLAVQLDDGPRVAQDEFGALTLRLPAGEHRLRIFRGDTLLSEIPITTSEDEIAQIIVNLPRRGEPQISFESSAGGSLGTLAEDTPSGPPGLLEGQIVSVEDGQPVAGARIFVSGTPIDVQTDAEGRYRIELPPGDYSLSVLAASFNAQTVSEIQIASEQTATRAIELTPAGLELPDFVVLEPFVEGSLAAFVEERRTSAAVTDVLGAEQISRAGDSDAAGALKRVTGLTLVDGKFIYVRGLGERYSSTLLNGAQVPSPDPTRRVVPLDLFPTELLSGILVQKTYTADMPGEFGGGTVQLRTRGVPESFLLRTSLTVGYNDGTTGEKGLDYRGGNRDWSGFDDGNREAPPDLLAPTFPTNPAAIEGLGEALAAKGYTISESTIGPDLGGSISIGDDFQFSDGAWSLGYIGAVRYSQTWDTREEERNIIALGADALRPVELGLRTSTDRNVDASGFFSTGLKVGELHDVVATVTQLRQTTDSRQFEDLNESGDVERRHELEWVENELTVRQFTGQHSLPELMNLVIGWQYTKSTANRYSPNTREYRYRFDEGLQEFVVNPFSNQQRFEDLTDDADEYRLDLKLPIEFSDEISLQVSAGASQLEKNRVSSIRRFNFAGGRPPGVFFDIEDFYIPANIGPGAQQQRLRDVTLATDAYTADQSLDAYYLMLDGAWGPWRLNAGARQEDNFQRVVTRQPFSANPVEIVGLIEESDLLPAATLTWAYSDNAQVRLAYSETLSRPDIREQSPADFIDPLLDIRVIGNPDLVQATIENVDLRWEYYFSATESFSIALFQKEFLNPIELVASPASGALLNIRNADSATNTGIEIDYYRSLASVGRAGWLPDFLKRVPWQDVFISANYARIDSTIDLGEDPGLVTNVSRPLQGQSPYVANLSLSYLPEDGDVEATLLYNVSGERISRVGIRGIPDTLEQPFHQLDFTLSAALPWDGWKAKLRLRNILDDTSEFLVGDQVARRFDKGREVAVSLEWRY